MGCYNSGIGQETQSIITTKEVFINKLLLFIPCYNCENDIIKVLSSIDCAIGENFTEIIVIDNGSKDRTVENAIKYAKEHKNLPITIMQNQNNINLGGSHKVAFNYAIENNFDFIFLIHGDNQGDIKDIKQILETQIYKKYDCCLGARFMKGSKLINYSKFRIFGNICFNILFSICLFKPIYDLGGGINIYNVNILKDKFYEKFPDALSFNYLMTMATDYYKHKYMFFPLTWKEEGQISNVKVTNQAIDLLKKLMFYMLNKQKFIKSELRQEVIEEYKSTCLYSNFRTT